MKVMVATNETQKRRSNDFSFTEENELVKFGFECDGEAVDGKCGCRRSFSGFKSSKAGTTAKIVEQDITRVEFMRQMTEALKRQGWIRDDGGLTQDEVAEDVDDLLSIASGFQVGDIIEKRGNKIQTRGFSLKEITDDRLEEKIFQYSEMIDNECGDDRAKNNLKLFIKEQERRGAKE